MAFFAGYLCLIRRLWGKELDEDYKRELQSSIRKQLELMDVNIDDNKISKDIMIPFSNADVICKRFLPLSPGASQDFIPVGRKRGLDVGPFAEHHAVPLAEHLTAGKLHRRAGLHIHLHRRLLFCVVDELDDFLGVHGFNLRS